MVNFYIYAKDVSGSTCGNVHFHANGLKSVEQFKNDVKKIEKELLDAGEPATESKIIYLHWGDKCYEVDEDITVQTYKDLESDDMNTEPETITEWIQNNYNICEENNKIKLLYLITDGQINYYSMKKCFKLNENMKYDTVVFHAFNEKLIYINLSVAASFLKSHCMIYRNYELFDDVNLSEEFEYDKINVENFINERENLKSYIRLKYINNFKHDAHTLREIDKLKKLRGRLFAELSAKVKKYEVNLDTKERHVFLREFKNTEWYKNLNGLKFEIEKSISTLINYITSDTKSYSFDALKFDTKFVVLVEEEPIVDVDFTSEQEIEFPDIILDDEKGIPVIILMKLNLLDKLIFHKTKESVEVSPASFSKFKSTMACPLFLINDPDISESIGYFYTLNAFKLLLANNTKTEPRTRRPFHGGLVLTDTDEFDKYNDYILSVTYFDSRKTNYNVGLFYYVLWKNSENKEWMDRNVVEQFKKYVMRRICATVCRVGLSSLPRDPNENTSLLTALWYCVDLSSTIFKDDPQNFMQERLRMHHSVAHYMIEILKYFDYDLDMETINKRIDMIRHVASLKRIPSHVDKVYFLLEEIFKKVNGFLVSDIEHPCNIKNLNYLRLNHKDMLPDNVVEEKVDLNDYVSLLYLSNSKNVKISKETYRPFFTIDQEKSYYSELVKVFKKVVINNDKDEVKIIYDDIDALEFDKIMSSYKLFMNFVEDFAKYPTLPKFIEYIHKKKKRNGGLVTIFATNVLVEAEEVYSQYQEVISEVDVDKFIEITKKYANRLKRVKAERILKFNNDIDIYKFLTKEELKVNLKRKIRTESELNDLEDEDLTPKEFAED